MGQDQKGLETTERRQPTAQEQADWDLAMADLGEILFGKLDRNEISIEQAGSVIDQLRRPETPSEGSNSPR